MLFFSSCSHSHWVVGFSLELHYYCYSDLLPALLDPLALGYYVCVFTWRVPAKNLEKSGKQSRFEPNLGTLPILYIREYTSVLL